MSDTLAARARAEADQAEQEDDLEPDEPTPDEEPAPDEPADDEPSSNMNMEKALAALEKEDARHTKRVAEIMGDDFELAHRCPACLDFAAGFTLTAPEEAPPLLYGDDLERCAKCNGYGVVLTHALTEHGRTQTCYACTGQGFTTKTAQPFVPDVASAADLNPNHSAADQLRAQGYMVIEPPARAGG